MIGAVLAIPVIGGLLAMITARRKPLFAILVATAVAHLGATISLWVNTPAYGENDWLGLDDLGVIFLGITSVLFLGSALYLVAYLNAGGHSKDETPSVGGLKRDSVFVGGNLLFLGTMTLVTVSQNLGVLWVAIEGTTLASASLIYFHRNQRSLEATWKYLLIGSVGIALALAGNFFLAIAGADSEAGITVTSLVTHAETLDATMVKVAFVLFVVGYGTKMGLAPMHNWLPDAHSEAPSAVSALLSGALLNCAFLAILRNRSVLVAVDGGVKFGSQLLIGFGVLSLLIAAIFIIGQHDYKRLLAYSSVEHMGIMALGVGLGGPGLIGAVLHAVNHSLTKAGLFLTSGNILTVFRTKQVAGVRGLLKASPGTGLLWVLGLLAISGSPPFGTFPTEFAVFRAAFTGEHWPIGVIFLAALSIVFIGLMTVMVNTTQGESEPAESLTHPITVVVPAVFLVGVLVLGVHVPHWLLDAVTRAAESLGAG